MKKYKEFMTEKDALHGHPSGYGKGIKGKDEKKQKDAFDKNVQRYKDNPDDPKAFEPTAVDKKIMKKREKGEMPPAPKSKHTEDKGPCWDGYKQIGMKKKGGRMVPDCVPEEVELEENDKALANKAKESGEPLGDLKKVYKRGLAAYASGHRPGMTQHQWAMARVNSYIKGGKARTVDKDVRESAKVKLRTKARSVKADIGVRG
jgi:hypothetical protein|tara:strand:+ start:1311 stop:1922 length:612 start_codon:yes stop_codon:yes gene_type:complete